MGFGLPAAIGAQMAVPDALVVCIAGDGSLQMNSQEMATARVNNLPIKVLLLNNSCLGMVRQWQQLFYHDRFSQTLLEDVPDFVKLGEAYGWHAARVTDPARLKEAIVDMIAADGPAILDVRVAKCELVLPMVAPGSSIEESVAARNVAPTIRPTSEEE